MKKIFIVITCSIIMFGSSFSFANSNNTNFSRNQKQAIRSYKILKNHGLQNNKVSTLNSLPLDSHISNNIEFCGTYINENGNLVLQLTQKNEKLKSNIRKLLKGYDIKI